MQGELGHVSRGLKRAAAALRASRPAPTGERLTALPSNRQEWVITELAAERSRAMKRYRTAVEALRLRARDSDQAAEVYLSAVRRLGVDELTLFDVVMIARNHRQPLTHGDSFFRRMVERRRKKQLGVVPEKYIGTSKTGDLRLAELLGVRVPKTLWTGALEDVPNELRRNAFMKPTKSSGAKGAFYLFGDENYFSAFSSEQLTSWNQVRDACREQLRPASAASVTWEIQELVNEGPASPGRDLKFFAFYGEIGLIQEVSRFPLKQYEFFDADGSIADCGRDREYEPPFRDPADTLMDKGKIADEKLEIARRFSRSMPVPFMRIDFLNGKDDLAFCEFSASPGMAHTFNLKYDQILGRMYNEAEIRLVNDLLEGKSFEGFAAWSLTRTSAVT